MAEEARALQETIRNQLSIKYGIPMIGGTPEQKRDYALADAVSASVASHVLFAGNSAEQTHLKQTIPAIANMGFCIGREARNAGVAGIITPGSVSGFLKCTEADVARLYIKMAVGHTARRKSITDIENGDVFRTASGSTITARELLQQAAERPQEPSGGPGKFQR